MIFKKLCHKVTGQLWAYSAQRLSEGERERVEHHLRECAMCRKEAEAFAVTVDLLEEFRAAPTPASQTDWHTLRVELLARAAVQPAPSYRPRPISALSSAACALAVAFLLWHRVAPASLPAAPSVQAINPAAPEKAAATREWSPPISVPIVQTTAAANPPDAPQESKEASERDLPVRKSRLVVAHSRKHLPRPTFAVARKERQRPKKAAGGTSQALAMNVDGENMLMPILPVNYVLPDVETTANLDAPHRYVIGQIKTEAPDTESQTDTNTEEELQPW